MMGDDRPNVYEDNGKIIYRASSVGNCIKSLVAIRSGMEPSPHPDWLLEKFAEGNVNEPIILNHLRSLGWTVDYDGDDNQLELELPIGENVIIRCHPDGQAYLTPDDVHVVEAKAFGQVFWDKYMKHGITAFPYYATQVTIEMAGTGLPCLWVMGLKDDLGTVVKYHIERITEPPLKIGAIKAKIAKVENWSSRGELPACDYDQYPCQFFYLHDDGEGEGEEPAADGKDTELELWASEYIRGKDMEAAGKALKQPAGEHLLKLLEQGGKKKWSTESVEVMSVTRANQKVDTAGLIEEFGREEVGKHITTTTSTFVKVTPKKPRTKRDEK